jgi:hypothetical protein
MPLKNEVLVERKMVVRKGEEIVYKWTKSMRSIKLELNEVQNTISIEKNQRHQNLVLSDNRKNYKPMTAP